MMESSFVVHIMSLLRGCKPSLAIDGKRRASLAQGQDQ